MKGGKYNDFLLIFLKRIEIRKEGGDKMPVCDSCGKPFNVEKKPGALLFSHPKSVKKAGMVKKYHICQDCEKDIILRFKKK